MMMAMVRKELFFVGKQGRVRTLNLWPHYHLDGEGYCAFDFQHSIEPGYSTVVRYCRVVPSFWVILKEPRRAFLRSRLVCFVNHLNVYAAFFRGYPLTPHLVFTVGQMNRLLSFFLDIVIQMSPFSTLSLSAVLLASPRS